MLIDNMTKMNISWYYMPSYKHLNVFPSEVKSCQVKQNLRKTWKWVGGSSPNSDFNFGGKLCVFVFFVLFSCLQLLKKIVKNWIGGWAVWGLANPSFSRIFGHFLT